MIAGPSTDEQRYTCPHCRATFQTAALQTERRTYRGYGYHGQVRTCPEKCPSCGGQLVNQFQVAMLNESVFKKLVDQSQHDDAKSKQAKINGAQSDQNSDHHELLGSWKLVAGRSGQHADWVPTASNLKQLKHITSSHYSWVRFNMDTKSMVGAGGGTYTADAENYIEIVQYAFGEVPTALLGQKQSFSWQVDGDSLQQSGTLSDGIYFAEKYVRAIGQ